MAIPPYQAAATYDDGQTCRHPPIAATFGRPLAGAARVGKGARLRFQETMTATTVAVIEEIMGRKVLTYQSQILFDPKRAIEIFVLDS